MMGEVLSVIRALAGEGLTMLIVTHNDIISSMTHKVIKIRDGQIYEEYVNTNRIPAEKLEW